MWRAIKKFFIDLIGNIRVYKGGIIFFGNSSYKLKGSQLREILELVKPGDILLNRHDHFVSGWFIKGDFKHAGLMVNNNEVIHVIGEGIQKEDVLTFTRADAFAIIRCKSDKLTELAIKIAYEQLAKLVKYDYDFDITSNYSEVEFYCSEFTDYCYGHPLKISGKKYIFPSDYLEPHPLYEVIYVLTNR